MADWNPQLYRRFEDERTRPAAELLARVAAQQPALVYDLGCGPGNSTELLVRRWPHARVVGVDNSPAMLQSARARLPGVEFEQADIASWQPGRAPDVIYTNATLQWVPGHETLVPRLFSLLAPGGVLAVQMPDNRDEWSHRAMRDVARQQPFAASIGDPDKLRSAVLSLHQYYDMLAPQAASVDVFHTIYQHRMQSAAAIVEWVSGTGLKPFVEKLPASQQPAYLAAYQALVEQHYPVRSDGLRLLAFPRFFLVAHKR